MIHKAVPGPPDTRFLLLSCFFSPFSKSITRTFFYPSSSPPHPFTSSGFQNRRGLPSDLTCLILSVDFAEQHIVLSFKNTTIPFFNASSFFGFYIEAVPFDCFSSKQTPFFVLQPCSPVSTLSKLDPFTTTSLHHITMQSSRFHAIAARFSPQGIRTSFRLRSASASSTSSTSSFSSASSSSPVSTVNSIIVRQPSIVNMEEERRVFSSGLSVLEPRPIVYWGGMEERMGSF